MFTLYIFLSEGKRHESGMLRMSGFLHNLQQHSFDTSGQPLCIYADLAYPLRIHLQGLYKGGQLTVDQEEFNASTSKVREAVEWVFSDIVTYFAFLDFKKNLKIGLSTVGVMYSVCALLRNARTCLYGSTTSHYFDVQPPTLDDYFRV